MKIVVIEIFLQNHKLTDNNINKLTDNKIN